MDNIKVSVGLSSKVSNPMNRFENSTFDRRVERSVSVSSLPDDPDKLEAYEAYIQSLILKTEQELKKIVDEMIQDEIDQFIEDNSGE